MNANLQLLVHLQTIDLKISGLRKDMDALPREIERREQGLLKTRVELQSLLEEVGQEEKKRKSLERAVEDEKEQLAKSKRKIPEVKTNKEYTALLAEIENMEKTIYRTEDEILNIMELVEQNTNIKKKREQEIEREEELFNRFKDQKEKELATFNQELDRKVAERARLAADLNKPLLDQYERLKQIRNGIAVVNVVENVCQGCHMTLPPQVVAEIRKGEGVILCDHCNRILFMTS